MNQVAEGQRGQLAFGGSTEEQTGCYVYCVVRTQGEVGLELLGIQGEPLHTVVRDGLSAVVHLCPTRPYQSGDPEVVATWVVAHHQVVEAAWKRWGAVVPVHFNTIIRAEGEKSARENLLSWLEAGYPWLTAKLNDLEGKAEYAVQVFWNADLISRQVALANPEVRRLEEEIPRKPQGLAYMERQRLEATLRRGIEARVAQEYQACYASISRWADSIQVEKLKPGVGRLQMLVNLSCLVSQGRQPALAEELNGIGAREGFSVRLVGPMPPYSFC